MSRTERQSSCPIGPEGGSGQLPGQEDLVSPEMVATLKGRDLMVDRYGELFGTATPASTSSTRN